MPSSSRITAKASLPRSWLTRSPPSPQGRGLTITVDPNPNNLLEWKGVTAIKPNRHEAFKVAGLPETPISNPPFKDPTLLSLASTLFEKWETEQLLITFSEQGMVLFVRGGAPQHLAPSAHEVFDVSGAGRHRDRTLHACSRQRDGASDAALISNYASGVVVGKIGTATLSRQELIQSMRRRRTHDWPSDLPNAIE